MTKRREACARHKRVNHQRDMIAVTGLSCRLPGAPTPDAFGSCCAAARTPSHAHPKTGGASSTIGAGFLDQIDQFNRASSGFLHVRPLSSTRSSG